MLTYSEYFAAGWGIFLILVALLFLRFKHLPALIFSYYQTRSIIRMTGFVLVLFGIIHIAFHNIWNPNFAALISAFGWITMLKGITLIANPSIIKLSKSIANSHLFTTYLFLAILFGLYLLNSAFYLI